MLRQSYATTNKPIRLTRQLSTWLNGGNGRQISTNQMKAKACLGVSFDEDDSSLDSCNRRNSSSHFDVGIYQ